MDQLIANYAHSETDGHFVIPLVEAIPSEATHCTFNNVTLSNTDDTLFLLCYNVRATSLNASRLPVVARIAVGHADGEVPMVELKPDMQLPRTSLSLRLYSATQTRFVLADIRISFMVSFYYK